MGGELHTEKLAAFYLDFEAERITWLDFLKAAIAECESIHVDAEPFTEFLKVMESTSYPEEKQSYQSVEIHCVYAVEIESIRQGG